MSPSDFTRCRSVASVSMRCGGTKSGFRVGTSLACVIHVLGCVSQLPVLLVHSWFEERHGTWPRIVLGCRGPSRCSVERSRRSVSPRREEQHADTVAGVILAVVLESMRVGHCLGTSPCPIQEVAGRPDAVVTTKNQENRCLDGFERDIGRQLARSGA